MRCPNCQTINRDDRATCYHCGKDLQVLRLIINKAKQHYNDATEKLADDRPHDALADLEAALELDSRLVPAHVLKGTILARLERFEEAREAWERALALDPETARAYRYVGQVEGVRHAAPVLRRLRGILLGAAAVVIVSLGGTALIMANLRDPDAKAYSAAWVALAEGDLPLAQELARSLRDTQRRDALTRALRAESHGQLVTASQLARAGETREALRILRETARVSLGPELREAVAREMNFLRTEYFARHDSLAGGFLLDVELLGRIHALNLEIRQLFPANAPDAELAWTRVAAQMAEQFRAELLPLAPLFDQPAAAPRIEARLQAWKPLHQSENPVIRDLVDKAGLPEFLEGWRTALVAMAAYAARMGDRPSFETNLARLERWGSASELEAANEHRLELVEAERRHALAQLDMALDAGDPETIHLAALVVEKVGAEPSPARAARVLQARERLAVDAYYRLMQMAGRIERLDLDEADAREVRRLVQIADGPLPARIEGRARDSLRFFSLQASRRLGDNQSATQELNRLKAQHPGSPYLLILEQEGFAPHG
jgi:tetratricopeptide (TPR) repeat protein